MSQPKTEPTRHSFNPILVLMQNWPSSKLFRFDCPNPKLARSKTGLTQNWPYPEQSLVKQLYQYKTDHQRQKILFRMSTVAHIPSGDSIKSDRPANHGSTNHNLRFQFNQFDIHNSIDEHFYNSKYTQGN